MSNLDHFQHVIFAQKRPSPSPPNRYPKNEEIAKQMESMFESSLVEKFRDMNMDGFMGVLSTYLDSKTTPTNPIESVSTPRESRMTVVINEDSATKTLPSKIAANSKSNELSTSNLKEAKPNGKPVTPNTRKFEQNVDKKLLNYQAGKSALISADGTVKIDGTIVYKKIRELKSDAGYAVSAKDGKLSVNNKIIFKNDPKSKFKIPFNNKTSYFRSNIKTLKLVITEDASLKCVDSDNKVVWLK